MIHDFYHLKMVSLGEMLQFHFKVHVTLEPIFRYLDNLTKKYNLIFFLHYFVN